MFREEPLLVFGATDTLISAWPQTKQMFEPRVLRESPIAAINKFESRLQEFVYFQKLSRYYFPSCKPDSNNQLIQENFSRVKNESLMHFQGASHFKEISTVMYHIGFKISLFLGFVPNQQLI